MLKGVHTSGLLPCNWSQFSHIRLTSTTQASLREKNQKDFARKAIQRLPEVLETSILSRRHPIRFTFQKQLQPKGERRKGSSGVGMCLTPANAFRLSNFCALSRCSHCLSSKSPIRLGQNTARDHHRDPESS